MAKILSKMGDEITMMSMSVGENTNIEFDEWNELKKRRNCSGSLPMINDGDIWWCAVGKNVGIEIDGKGRRFSRPVLIMKKLSK